ncbi:MAG: diphthine--ammonia ligase [Methanoculleaceae archaeon]
MSITGHPLRLAALNSGGKDSLYACWQAMQKESVCCMVTVYPENPESYLLHTPNVRQVRYQAAASGLPLIAVESSGIEEEEIDDIRRALEHAMDRFGIDGIVTGAVQSVYQATRIQQLCADLDLWCFNPLWQTDPHHYLRRLVAEGFIVCITAVAAGPLDESWLGRKIDAALIQDLERLEERYGISIVGEGGEFETYVLDAPFFSSRISITRSSAEYHRDHGLFRILGVELLAK